jgi:hypothetical protein
MQRSNTLELCHNPLVPVTTRQVSGTLQDTSVACHTCHAGDVKW